MAETMPAEKPLPAFLHIPKFRYDSPPKKVEDPSEFEDDEAIKAAVEALYDKPYCTVKDVGFPPWALDAESLSYLNAPGTREPSDSSESSDLSEASVCESSKSLENDRCCNDEHEEVEVDLPPLQRQDLEEAYDETIDAPLPGDGDPFQWSSMKDAARAAWAGGTSLLRYWEVLPRGAAKALARLREDAPNRPALALELGMGRGRLAMQIFLSGASVIGVEFGAERYHRAVAACERLAHRRPELFMISKAQSATGPTVLLQNMLPGKWGGASYKACRGDFCSVLSNSEIQSATLVILQVQIPQNSRHRICNVLSLISEGCRVLSRSDLTEIWQPGEFFPFKSLGTCKVATSWAPIRGHEMYIWEKMSDSASESPADVVSEPETD